MNDLQRENRLIISTAAFPLKTGHHYTINRMVTPSLDWDYVMATVLQHGLTPLLFLMLNEKKQEVHVPEKVIKTLQGHYLSSLRSYQRLYGKLVPVLDKFSEFSIPTMLLKGPALCLTVYPDLALRYFGDLDILVPKDKVIQRQRLLEEIGFIKDDYPAPDDRNEALDFELAYQLEGDRVELHWNLIDTLAPFTLNIAHYWEDARQVKIGGIPVQIMSHGNQLVHLCLHQFHHRWTRIRDLTDISLVLEKYRNEIDWEDLVYSASSQQLGRCIYYNLTLAQQVLGVSLATIPMAQFLGRSQPTYIANEMLKLYSNHILDEHFPRRLWVALFSVEGFKNKTVLISRILKNPFPRITTDDSKNAYPVPSRIRDKVAATIKSIYLYRKLVYILLFRHLFVVRRRQNIKKD